MKAADTFRWLLLRHPWMFAVWRCALMVVGKVCFFWMKPLVSADDIDAALLVIHPGDLIGVRSRRYLTSYLIPGRYKHTAVYLGHGVVAHAVSPKVKKEPLIEFLANYDGFKIVRPTWPYEWKRADRVIFQHLGTEYDFVFETRNKAMYCHELGAKALEAGRLNPKMRGSCWAFEDLDFCSFDVMEAGK